MRLESLACEKCLAVPAAIVNKAVELFSC